MGASLYFVPLVAAAGMTAPTDLAPGGKLGLHGPGPRGLAGCQVPPLVGVLSQIVQFQAIVLEPFDQLPVAVPDRAGGRASLVAVVRVVPEQGASVERAAGEQGDEAHAVDVLCRGRRQAGKLEDGRVEVGAEDRCRADAARPGHPRRTDDPRHADASLVEPSLAGPERRVRGRMPLGRRQAAVVGREDHDRPIRDSGPLQGRQHAADGGVELLEHRRVGRIVLDQANPLLAFRAPGVGGGGPRRLRSYLAIRSGRAPTGMWTARNGK